VIKVICFFNYKGGSGKTSALECLSLYWAEQSHVVMIRDFDRIRTARAFVTAVDHPNITYYKLGNSADYLLIDTPAGITAGDMNAQIESSHLAIMPVELNSSHDIQVAVVIVPEIEEKGKCRILFNKVVHNSVECRERHDIAQNIGLRPFEAYWTRSIQFGNAADGWRVIDKQYRVQIETLGKEIDAWLDNHE